MLRITIDTREITAWSFPPGYATTERGTISAGDYALQGDEANFAVERKSLSDFVGTVSTGWDRFRRELGRMAEAGFPARIIIVEGSFAQIVDHPDEYNHPQVTPAFVRSRIAHLAIEGVQVLFADNAHYAAYMAWGILKARQEQLDGSVFAGVMEAVDTDGNTDKEEREVAE